MKNIKIVKTVIALIVCLFGFSLTSFAQTNSPYSGKQFSLSTFATYQFNKTSDRIGEGIGLGYSFGKNVAVNLSTSKNNWNDGSFIENLSLSPVLRLPIKNSPWAIYATGGVTFGFQNGNTRSYYAGPGVEYRFGSHFGVYTEADYLFRDSKLGKDGESLKTGFKFKF